MKGFTGEYFNGLPVFIKEDYDRTHIGMGEKEKLEEILGNSFSSLQGAIAYAEFHNPKLLYHLKGWAYDNRLLNGDPLSNNLWIEYKSGYVHKITGEYVKGLCKPCRDSYPPWFNNRFVLVYEKEDKTLEHATTFALYLISLLKNK